MENKEDHGFHKAAGIKLTDPYHCYIFDLLCKRKGLKCEFSPVNRITQDIGDKYGLNAFVSGSPDQIKEVIKEWNLIWHNFLEKRFNDFFEYHMEMIIDGK